MHVVFNMSLVNTMTEQNFGAFQPCQLADVIILKGETAKSCDPKHLSTGKSDWQDGASAVAETQPLYSKTAKNAEQKPDIVKWVVVTRGSKDIVIVEGHPTGKSETKLSSVKVTPVELSEGSDRRGVGDVFAGGLVGSLAKGHVH